MGCGDLSNDTVYGTGCGHQLTKKPSDRICKIKGDQPQKALNFSIICADLEQIFLSFTRIITKPVFKLMKRALPGPFTFILDASNQAQNALAQAEKNHRVSNSKS